MSVDLIRYDLLVQDALRDVVRRVLTDVARDGLPGEHHFFIGFNTGAPGVKLSSRLKERHPKDMTIVLQHQFWDLIVGDKSFEVGLSFNGIPERLHIPYDALTGFYDPSVKFGLQFEPSGESEEDEPAPAPALAPVPAAPAAPARARTTSVPATKPTEIRPAEIKPAEAKPAATRPAEVKPAETRPPEKAPVRAAPAPAAKAPDAKPGTKAPEPVRAAKETSGDASKEAGKDPAGKDSGTKDAAAKDPGSKKEEGTGAQVVRLDAFRKK